MATPNILKAAEGFDIYQTGPLVTNYPWKVITSANVPQIATGAGVFGGSALVFNQGSANGQAIAYQFPSSGQFMRNSAANTGVFMYGVNLWFQCTVAPTTTTALPIVQWSTMSATTSVIPAIGIMNPTSGGLQLALASTVAGIATSPYTVPISTGTWYWISAVFVGYPNAQLYASYTVNSVPVQQNISLTFGSDPLSTNICNSLVFYGGGTSLGQYKIDDLVIQASSGADTDWPPGNGGTSTPTVPNIANFPIISPRQIFAVPYTANGSITQWSTSDGVTPNYEAVQTSGEYVQATASGQTDLYKISADSIPLTDCIGIVQRANSNKYLSIGPSMKTTSGSSVIQNPGVVAKGVSSFITVQEQNVGNATWDAAGLDAAEFGQTAL